MPGLFHVKELEARKRALLAENEVYRQTLKFELRNIGLYAAHAKLRFSQARAFSPVFLLGMPAAGFFLRQMLARKRERRRSRLSRLAATAVFGWKIYQKVVPFCRDLFSGRKKISQNRQWDDPEWQAERYNG